MFRSLANRDELKLFTPHKDQLTTSITSPVTYPSTNQNRNYLSNSIHCMISENQSAISFAGQIQKQDIAQLMKTMRMVVFLSGSSKTNQQTINCKMAAIKRLKIDREDLENKLSSARKFTAVRKSALHKKKLKLIEERGKKRYGLEKEIQAMKKEIIQMKTESSQNRYDNRFLDESAQGKNNKQTRHQQHRRLYSQGPSAPINDLLSRAKKIYVPMPAAYHPPVHYSPTNNWPVHYSPTSNWPVATSRHIQMSIPHPQNPQHSARNRPISMDNSLFRHNSNHRQRSPNPQPVHASNFALQLGQALHKKIQQQEADIRTSTDKNGNNEQIGPHSSRGKNTTSRKNSSKLKRPSSRNSKYSKSQKPQDDQSGDEIIRQILQCSNNGKKETTKIPDTIGKSLGFMITESSDPDLQLAAITKKDNLINRPPTPKKLNSPSSDSFNNSMVNFTNINITFRSAEKGNSSSSREDGHKPPGNAERVERGRNKQIRESKIDINLSHEVDSSQEHVPDDFNNIKYKTLEIEKKSRDQEQNPTYKTIHGQTLAEERSSNTKKDQALKKTDPISYQTEELVVSHYEETPRDDRKERQDGAFPREDGDQDDDFLSTIQLNAKSKMSRNSDQTNYNKNKGEPAIGRTFHPIHRNEKDDEADIDMSMESIRLSTVSIFSRDKNLQNSLKESNFRNYHQQQSESQFKVSSTEEKAQNQHPSFSENSFEITVLPNSDHEQLKNLSTSAPMKRPPFNKAIFSSPKHQSKVNESIVQLDEQQDGPTSHSIKKTNKMHNDQ